MRATCILLVLSGAAACGTRNPAVALGFAPATVELRAPDGAVQRVRVLASRGAQVEVWASAPWLAVTPAKLDAPGEIELLADAARAGAGTHTAQVLVRAAGGEAVALPVSFQVAGAAAGPPVPDPVPAPTPAPDARITKEALARVSAATVLIEATYRPHGPSRDSFPESERYVSWGSGFVVHEAGLVLTNAHVVDAVMRTEGAGETPARRAANARTHVLHRVTVRLASGTPQTRVYDAQVLCTRPYPLDLALLRIVPDAPLTAVPDLDPAIRGLAHETASETERVWAIGFPRGKGMESELERFSMSRNPNGPDLSVREGIVTALRRDADGAIKAVEHSCNIEPGNSGGPLVNLHGRLVGVNSLGGNRSAFAIPVTRVLDTFHDTLACNGYGTMEALEHRTVVVDPAGGEAGDGVVVVRTIAEGFAAARLGDVLRLAAGEYPLASTLHIPSGVRIAGAGVGRTVLRAVGEEGRGFTGYAVHAGGPRTFEMHDLTIVNDGGNGLWIYEQAADTYIHDLEIRTSAYALGIGKETSPDVVRCEFSGPVVLFGPGRGARLEGVFIRYPRNVLLSTAAVSLLEGASATLEGCRIVAAESALAVRAGSKLHARGCEFGTVDGGLLPGVVLAGCEAGFQECLFWSTDSLILGLFESARATVAGCRFVGGWRLAAEASGEGTQLTVENSAFLGRGPCVLLTGNASGAIRGSAVLTDSDRDSAALRWIDAPPAAMRAIAAPAVPVGLTPEQQAAIEARERRFRAERPFAVVLSAPVGTVELADNLFSSQSGGTAVRLEGGASFLDRGGNEAVGASQVVLRTDERSFQR